MQIGDIIEILRPVFENAQRQQLRGVQLREGLAAATDGRILVKVEMPGFVPTEAAAKASYAPALDMRPEEPAQRFAGRDWILETLGPAIEEEWCRIVSRFDKERDAAVEEFNRISIECPHCGEDLAVEESEGWGRNRLLSLDDWIDLHAPPQIRSTNHVALHTPGIPEDFRVFVKDLYRALVVAVRLGSADELRLSEHQLHLVGTGFIIIVVSAGWVNTASIRTLRAEGGEGDKG